MRRSKFLVLVLLLFSIVMEMAIPLISVQAKTNEIELVDEESLKLSYTYEEKKDAIEWQLMFDRQSEKGYQQRLKFRLTDDKDKTIDYSTVKMDHLIEEDGWLKEKDFSESVKDQLSWELSASVKKINVYVQLDKEKPASEEGKKDSSLQENILEREEPFVLKTKSTAESQTKTSQSSEKKAPQETKSTSEEFIGPHKEGVNAVQRAAAATNGISRMYANHYEVKTPGQVTDRTGTYPEPSWQPTGQPNVINHQGGQEGRNGWDNNTSWDVTQDNHTNSYIHYGQDLNNSNVSLRKLAQQTDKEDEFKVKLNVRGNTTYKPGVDIVFLLDNSGSMTDYLPGRENERKQNAVNAMRKIVDELKKVYVPSAQNIRIGAHIFSDYQYNAWGNKPGEQRTFPLTSDTSAWSNMVKIYDEKATAMGSTFTQRGLKEAQDIFDDAGDTTGRQKLLFVLTDGAPNRSWTTLDNGTPNNDMYKDLFYFTNFDSGSKGNYKVGSDLGAGSNKTSISNPYRGVISSHITTTNSTAMDLKNAGIEIHTIAVELTINVNESNMGPVLLRGLYKMSTKKANATNGPLNDVASDFHFYNVENADDLVDTFKAWYDTVIRTVDRGIISDPLGDMVELVGDPEWRQVDTTGNPIEADAEPQISVSSDRRKIEVNNINLTANQEIEVEYTVRLKTSDPTFASSTWYPANKTTTLKPTPERTGDKLEFGVPSVRLKTADFVIPVKKIWSDKHQNQDNYWILRPETVTATLQKLEGSTWQDVESIDLKSTNNWEGNFSAVEGGEDKTYRVVEGSRTAGYKAPVVNQQSFTSENIASGGITITNELLRGNYQFWKFMEDGTTKFTSDLPKFKVTRSDGKVLAENLTPDATGKVAINDFPIGTYTVEETYVPKGFQKMADFEIVVTENNPPTSLVFKVNGRTDDYHAINRLKDFSVKVEKIDPNDNALTGAVFKLTGPNGYEETISNGSTFTFTGLRPGIYSLKEVDNPEGYQRIQEPIAFVINQDGSFNVSSHPNVSDSSGGTGSNNTITLKVTNKKVKPGTLPRTGNSGIKGFFLIAGMLTVTGGTVGVFCFYKVRKELAKTRERMNGK
ncbi:SpaA isopeptide-forming pilin-related protein [Enterococcus raffinosus]|uniref:SpaA isopeptide-forming pilin-related protein n=1 Tax=Enterococcus raffinosus TaxID=71452 RepID=UPI002891B7D5|nr:SpaA isopeptide-forming pilin-related protein [Enterococcus raffinosus]MDT2553782.1 SpaA isopeptide-forming pilin-related protein [Enterococcus raffinosus]